MDCESGISSKRFVLVIAGISLSLATIILAIAAVMGVGVEMELWAVTTPLSAMAGASYITKKDDARTQRIKQNTTTPSDE